MTLWERLWDRWALVLILSPFLFGGLFGFYVITVRPLTRALLARLPRCSVHPSCH